MTSTLITNYFGFLIPKIYSRKFFEVFLWIFSSRSRNVVTLFFSTWNQAGFHAKMQTIRSVLFWSFENIPSGKVLQKDDKKKVGIFFWFKIMYLRVSGNFYEVDSILERERVNKKTVKTFLFYTRFSVWFLASYFDYLSGFLQIFLVYIPRTNLDSPLAFPLWFLLKRVNWFEWTFLWLWKLSILGQFHFLKLSTFLFK